MSGGMGRVKRSGDQEKLSLRDKRFGVYLAPLPLSLKLPEVDRKPMAGKSAERQSIALSV
jgi:hypothetical protein